MNNVIDITEILDQRRRNEPIYIEFPILIIEDVNLNIQVKNQEVKLYYNGELING